ncbi:MAG: hypothetical protein IK095_08565, partial [Oscillospiraceae bacterium]|nr:hypothetical protein [Oscillospiraceae bacterium]
MLNKDHALELLRDMRKCDLPETEEVISRIITHVEGMSADEDFDKYMSELRDIEPAFSRIMDRRLEMLMDEMSRAASGESRGSRLPDPDEDDDLPPLFGGKDEDEDDDEDEEDDEDE